LFSKETLYRKLLPFSSRCYRFALRGYALNLWPALTRYCDEGRLEIDKAMVSYCTSLWGLSWARVSSVC
jgi:hypothetical protein